MKFFGGMGRLPRTNRSDLGGDVDHDPDPRFLDLDPDTNP